MPAAEPKNIRMTGPAWEPAAASWRRASPADRLAYWRALGAIAHRVKRAEIAEGRGKDGRPLKRVKPESRPDGAKGPPLIPHDETSRTYRLLATHADVGGATLFWRGGWKTILGYHAYKHGPRSLPVRNTIGISPAGRRAIVAAARAWWDARTRKPVRLSPRAERSGKFDPRSRKIQVIATRG